MGPKKGANYVISTRKTSREHIRIQAYTLTVHFKHSQYWHSRQKGPLFELVVGCVKRPDARTFVVRQGVDLGPLAATPFGNNGSLGWAGGFQCSIVGRFGVTFTTSQAFRAYLLEAKEDKLQEWACPNWAGPRRYIFRLDKSFFLFKFCPLGKEKHFHYRDALVKMLLTSEEYVKWETPSWGSCTR